MSAGLQGRFFIMNSQLQSLKQWKANERCLYGSRQAIIFKITHNERRCTLSVCEGADRSDLLNWVRRSNVPVSDLEEFPPVPVGGFKWDEQGFLDWYCLKNNSLPTGEDCLVCSAGDNFSSEPGYESKASGSEDDSLPTEKVNVNEDCLVCSAGDNFSSEPGYESKAGGSEDDSLPTEKVNVNEDCLVCSAGDNFSSEPGYESKAGGSEDDSLPTEKVNVNFGCVVQYSAAGSARGTKQYYRYQYKENGKVYNHHIKGGNVEKKLAETRATVIRQLITAGKLPCEIVEIIQSWDAKKK